MDVLRKLSLGVLFLALAVSGWAQPARETQIKCAFVLNFLKFVEWPNEKDPVVLGVYASDSLAAEMKALEAKAVRGKKVSVVRLSNPNEAKNCAAVFISETESALMQPVLNALKGHAVLTISDIPGFIEKGGGIGMVTERNRVRFAINATAIDAAGLKASSRLLQLAVNVQ